MPLVMHQRTFLLLFSLVLGGCADWRDALQGYPNQGQWSHERGPTRPGPSVQERGVLDSHFHMRALRIEAVPPAVSLEHEEASLADELVIQVLNIGAGSCHMVQCPNSPRVIVVDCGSSGASENDGTAEQLANYVQTHGLFSHPDTEILVTVSHPDPDHTNKIPVLLEGYPVQ